MDLKQLVAVVTVSEIGGVTKAAAHLRLAQPAVTRQVRALEDELGVALFERTRRGMVMTAAGEIVVERARRALLELERARAEVRPQPGDVRGIVTIGLLESVVDVLAAPLVDALAEHFPGIELRLLTAYSGHLQRWLDDRDVDLSLLYDLAPSPSLSVTPVVREQLWAVAPPAAGLRSEHSIAWMDVWKQTLVLPVSGHGLRTLVEQALAATGGVPQVRAETNSLRVQQMMVMQGRGWTILPASGVAGAVSQGLLSAAPLIEPEITRSVVLGLPRGGRVPPHVEAVATEVLRVARRQVRRGAWLGAELTIPA